MNRAIYSGPDIDSVLELARLLDISNSELVAQVSTTEQSYFTSYIPKRNGGYRVIDKPSANLKQMQRMVLDRILRNTVLPSYLLGSVPGKDYITDARQHTGKRVLIKADIRDFFPSVTFTLVFDIWRVFCCFPGDVSETLTTLTTYKRRLPQGAPTSSDIANLILWNIEPELEHELSALGYVYSRYVDDISISCSHSAGTQELKVVQDKLRRALSSKGLELNPTKLMVSDSSGRMAVHNINVNKKRPTISKEKRAKIRAAVRECEILSQKLGRAGREYQEIYSRTYGRVSELSRLHPAEAGKLFDRLSVVEPTTNITSENIGELLE